MAGLLDPKTRIFDTIMTNEGRRQASAGKMRIEYVSFSDASAIYALDTLVSGGLDFTSRITFEAGNLPQDQITYEVDDSGKVLTNFITSGTQYTVAAGQILSGSNYEIVSSSQFASLYDGLLKGSLQNFRKLSILQTPNPSYDNFNEFKLAGNNYKFTITPTGPIPAGMMRQINLDNVESLFFDKRLSHVPNFQYLPPINKPALGATGSQPIGSYPKLNQNPILSYDDLKPELDSLTNDGYKHTINFLETSEQNNLFCQFFETSNNQIIKLDVIDFGQFPSTETEPARHIFFVGKVFTDGYNTTTFVNMFFLVFEQ
jgi:hypothetical protein